ncbi:hypothetical protein Hanom_Chr15g01349121 [Helianthus anomalus]
MFCNLFSHNFFYFQLWSFIVFIFRFMLRSKFCDLTHRNVRLWFNIFTFRSKFCELTRRNVRV